MAEPSSIAGRLRRALLTLAWAFAIGLGLARWPAGVGHLARLAAAADPTARAALALEDPQSPFGDPTRGAGRRPDLGAGDATGRSSDASRSVSAAELWRVLWRARPRIAGEARVFLATPGEMSLYYGNFLLHPTRLEVAPGVTTALVDATSIGHAAEGASALRGDRARLAAAGYRLALGLAPDGLTVTVVELASRPVP